MSEQEAWLNGETGGSRIQSIFDQAKKLSLTDLRIVEGGISALIKVLEYEKHDKEVLHDLRQH